MSILFRSLIRLSPHYVVDNQRLTRFGQCLIPPEIIFISWEKMSDIRIAESELLTTIECDAEIQKIETRISEIRAIPQQSNLPLERKVLLELEEFIKLLEECKDVIKELEDSRRTPEGRGATDEITQHRVKIAALSDTKDVRR